MKPCACRESLISILSVVSLQQEVIQWWVSTFSEKCYDKFFARQVPYLSQYNLKVVIQILLPPQNRYR
jgi:hypothetical protein